MKTKNKGIKCKTNTLRKPTGSVNFISAVNQTKKDRTKKIIIKINTINDRKVK